MGIGIHRDISRRGQRADAVARGDRAAVGDIAGDAAGATQGAAAADGNRASARLGTVDEKLRAAGAGDGCRAAVIARAIQLDDGTILYREPADSGDGVVDNGRSATSGLSLNRQRAAERNGGRGNGGSERERNAGGQVVREVPAGGAERDRSGEGQVVVPRGIFAGGSICGEKSKGHSDSVCD